MADTTKSYYSLPTQAPQQHRSGSRRPPLTPSTVSSPCLSTHAPIATRRDSGSGSPTKASALLAKVASNPLSPRGETPGTSPMPSPAPRAAEMHSSPLYTPERPGVWRTESARYVRQHRQQDGYVSFPDFEKFCQSPSPCENQHREHHAVKT
ncbi:uncharacterized protein EI97DRAFT_462085 [Westerdykella ornata]|uniref:Uncharacterized protein n=1 Tax=Westerdykella ornata TaxID=318751 RepID=A0A6A6J6U6_WESOR|nr:uncharacterized protein EI97DRAFT_462085 [Westerdykella ornata]KAF2272301.1 hypothetical protein EI97DRAFT_462085 [Westerdykella ornata]